MSDYHVVKHAVGVVRVQSLGRSHFAPTLVTSIKLIADFTRVKRCTVEYTVLQYREGCVELIKVRFSQSLCNTAIISLYSELLASMLAQRI